MSGKSGTRNCAAIRKGRYTILKRRNLRSTMRFGARLRAVLIFACFCFAMSCNSPRTDMRTHLPAETLVYLETNDLGRLLRSLQDNKPFSQATSGRTDFSVLDGLQLAVGVTGFEASENQVTTENSILNFKPRFVAVCDTHSWDRHTLKFTEETLGNFVNRTYGGEVTLDLTDRATGKHFVWTATDGRKAFAVVSGSRVFFSNDETALEKSLAAARGDSANLATNEALGKLNSADPQTLAAGYISADGVAQLSNVAGVTTALEATDDDDGRSFIARVFPEFIRKTVREIVWTSSRTETGIEDRYSVSIETESAAALKETMKPAGIGTPAAEFLPYEAFSVTRYALSNPLIAWRSLLLVAGRNTDQASGNIIVAFAGSLLEPYGIANAERFLAGAGNEIWTVALDADGEKTAAVVPMRDAAMIRGAVSGINFGSAPEIRAGAEIRRSPDGELAAATIDGLLIVGDPETVLKCLDVRTSGENFRNAPVFAKFAESSAPAITFGREATDKTAALLGRKKEENLLFLTTYTTETRFTERGIDRRTSSPFGLVGRLLEQLDEQ